MLMTLEQEGAYRRLLDHQWLHGSIPADLRQMAVICKAIGAARMRSVWSGVSCCFEPLSGTDRLVNKRLERVRDDAEAHRDRQSQNGSKGAARRWQKDSDPNGVAIVSPMAKNSSAPAPAPALPHTTTAYAVVVDATTTAVKGWDAFETAVPEDYRDAVDGAIRAANQPDALRRQLVAMQEAITGGPSYTPTQIAQALHELAVAGSRVTSAGLRAFCRRIAAGERDTTTTTDAAAAWARELKGAA